MKYPAFILTALFVTACGTNAVPVSDPGHPDAAIDVADEGDADLPHDVDTPDAETDVDFDTRDGDLSDVPDVADVEVFRDTDSGANDVIDVPDHSDVDAVSNDADARDDGPDAVPDDQNDIQSIDIIDGIDSSDAVQPFCPESRPCLIDEVCYVEGQSSPFDLCQICMTTGGMSAWVTAGDGMPCGAGRVCFDGNCTGPLITEFMVANKDTIVDEDGDSSDWIEIYNPTSVALPLAGYRLTDNLDHPSRWVFPELSLGPQKYLVVFASGKDRSNPNGPLHTNFKLSTAGEFLALLGPDGRMIQSYPAFPPQVEDVSYGINVTIHKTRFVKNSDVAAIHVPVGSGPSADWNTPAFVAAEPDWVSGNTGVGFDQVLEYSAPSSGEDLGIPIADSVADWSAEGIQGENSWTYGYFDQTSDPDHQYSADAFVPFPRSGSGWGPSNFWTGWRYEGDPPWIAVGPEYIQPSGDNSIASHWAIRRYQAEVTGPQFIQWQMFKTEIGGDGVTGYVFHNGVKVDEVSIAGTDSNGFIRTLVLPGVNAGDLIDFAVTSKGPDGLSSDTLDGSSMSAAVWQLAWMKREIETDVAAAMAGISPSLYLRLPFDGTTGPINRLHLLMKYDDGFIGYLNGVAVASSNVPPEPAWNSVSTKHRPLAAAVVFEDFDITDHLGVLNPGGNTLAVQGLNSAVDDPTFLLLPEVEGRFVTYDVNSERYYGRPTPGADNDDGLVGPILQHLTPNGAVEADQDVVVSARVFFMSEGIASMKLTWRVMFGPETAVDMVDDGTGIYKGIIPAGAALPGQMVRWYIVVTDMDGLTVRGPAFPDPLDSDQYYGTVITDPTVVSNLNIIQWFIENPAAAGTYAGTRASLFYGNEFYDNVRFNIHGQSTQGFPKKSFNIDFNADHRFLLSPQYRRMKDINLLTNYADKSKVRNTMGYEVWRDSGNGYHLAFPMRVQLNGTFFEVGDFVEDGDDRWLERIGLNPDGALYKMYDGLWTTAAGEKKTRKNEDKSDLQALISGLDLTGDELRNYVYDNVNVAAMANFLAALIITGTTDCCHKNFYAYRDTTGNGEWRYLPWDVDLTFGHNWTCYSGATPDVCHHYFDDAMYPHNALYLGWSKLVNALWTFPEFKEMYHRRLRTLMDELQQSPETPYEDLKFERRIAELVEQIGVDGAMDYAAWPKWGIDQTMEQAVEYMENLYMIPRRVFLYETMGVAAGGPIPLAQQNPVISFGDFELSPDQPSEAWITLVNENVFAVDVSGWQVAGDISITLQPGAVIPPGGTLYLSPDVVVFRARAVPPTGNMGLFVNGNYSGDLMSVDSLVLLDREGVPVIWAR